MESKKSVKKIEQNLPAIPEHGVMRSYSSMKQMLEDAEQLIKSGMVPFKQASDVVLVMQTALDLGLSIPMALGNIYAIQGRVSAGVHILAGLLTRGGVGIEIVEDYVDIYHLKRKGGARITMTAEEINDKGIVVTTLKDYPAMIKEGYDEKILYVKIPAVDEVDDSFQDKRTTIKMTRSKPNKSTITRSYCLHEAVQAGYFADAKDNWIKHPKSMMWARCFSRCAKAIGSDLIMGLNEFTEMADTFDIEYEIDESNVARPIIEHD